jgi:hypothetical protein
LEVISEFLRIKKADCEVDQQQDGENEAGPCNPVHVHRLSPQLLAGLDVKKRHREKRSGEQQHHDVLHCVSPAFAVPAKFAACDRFKHRVQVPSSSIDYFS